MASCFQSWKDVGVGQLFGILVLCLLGCKGGFEWKRVDFGAFKSCHAVLVSKSYIFRVASTLEFCLCK